MTATPDNKDVYSRLERLERAVGNLQRQSTLSSASISGGNLTVRRGGSIRVIDGGSLIGEGDGTLDWEGNAHFGSDLLIDGNTNIEGTLGIGSNTTITGDTSVTGQLDVTGPTELGGNTDITGELTVAGDTDITGDLTVSGNTFLGGSLTYGAGNRPDVVDSALDEETNWQATNGGTVVSVSVPRPAGYGNATVIAQANGFYNAGPTTARACFPRFDMRIASTDFQLGRIPDNSNTMWITGGFSSIVTGTGPVNVSVRTVIGPTCTADPATSTNRMYLGVVVVFSE